MSDTVISVESISKKFNIGMTQAGSIQETFEKVFNRAKLEKEEFWAVKDVSFEVKQGDVLGIIGRNGAGKSTLLKILSRITPPTTGNITYRGRIASLLEVGTGFHSELSGKENIYLNGTILGMKREEITRKLEEIIDFSGIEKFIDTPVKHYSSGMFVRLAFAVAAHLEPEILIIDEVLAVGDAEFQRKCLGKMQDVTASDGRTVIFVSHSMGPVASICTRGIWLEHGMVKYEGKIKDTIDAYLGNSEDIGEFDENAGWGDYGTRRGTGECMYKSIKVKDKTGNETFAFDKYDTIVFDMEVLCKSYTDKLIASVIILSNNSNEVLSNTDYLQLPGKNYQKGQIVKFSIEIEKIPLNPGSYALYFWLGNNLIDPNPFDVVDKLLPNLVINTKGIENPSGFFSINAKITQ